MKKAVSIILFILVIACNNERVLLLPEIEDTEITEVLDVSPVYVFYDETQPDSTLFNRKNLIGTTNWLVNIDRRLTLKQIVPHLQYLQNKRRKASMHKNEEAKNYFTCNTTSIENLGFIEFTNVNYLTETSNSVVGNTMVSMNIKTLDDILLSSSLDINIKNKLDIDSIEVVEEILGDSLYLQLNLNGNLNFQDYITLKHRLAPFANNISMNEIINLNY